MNLSFAEIDRFEMVRDEKEMHKQRMP